MFLNNVPFELFEIAASFKNTDFQPHDIWLLDTQEFQLWVSLKCEPDVGIYVRFRRGQTPLFRTHECYVGTSGTEFSPWTNRDDVISRFCDWYLTVFEYRHQDNPDLNENAA